MSEAVENLHAVDEAHKREITQLHNSAKLQGGWRSLIIISSAYLTGSYNLSIRSAKREVETLQRTIQEKSGEIQHQQKRLADLERDKHTEVVKLRLEVNALPCRL